ncbi:MAG: 4-hydroxy-tetrahydrodipicolinate reductase [Bdellovibrionaceae bacterium]|nr:4-hydroxy-tetrahydrodipicolinate reductase [Pseudobdellovibrionaceae bacterium]MBX3033693.1 4-hydroxy-tetrahydrodipicolinate reductase [Pseudobdellovibrionaceae bacterium]
MKKLKVGLWGASGRMGQEVSRLLADARDLSLAEKSVDIWIDFSSPEGFDEILKKAVKAGTPLVSGTTGLSAKQKDALKKAGRKIPVLWASNMSLGVAVLNEAIRLFSRLEGFDFQIEEIHHNRKKDRPSGTALTLQETLREAVGGKIPDVLSMRGGGVFGVHKVWAFSEEEVLMFEHQALNRAVFARGALAAARWLAGRPAGLYHIRDVAFSGLES